eukprot:gene30896-41116_t
MGRVWPVAGRILLGGVVLCQEGFDASQIVRHVFGLGEAMLGFLVEHGFDIGVAFRQRVDHCITLFHGGQDAGDPGGEFDATVLKMGRSDVRVLVGEAVGRERDDQVTVFDSVGFAIEDFSTLRYVRDIAAEAKVGSDLDLVPAPRDPKDLFGVMGRIVTPYRELEELD